VFETRESFLAKTLYAGPHHGYRQVEDIILPLISDRTTVDSLFVFISYFFRTAP